MPFHHSEYQVDQHTIITLCLTCHFQREGHSRLNECFAPHFEHHFGVLNWLPIWNSFLLYFLIKCPGVPPKFCLVTAVDLEKMFLMHICHATAFSNKCAYQ